MVYSVYPMLYLTYYKFLFSLPSLYTPFIMNLTVFPSSHHPLFPYSICHSTGFSTPPALITIFFSLFPLHALSSHSRFHLTYAAPHILCRASMLAFLFSTRLTLVHILLYTLDTPHLMLHSKAGPFCHLFSSCHSMFPHSTLHYVQPYSVQHVIHDFALFMPLSLPMLPSACSTLHSSCSIRNVLCWAASTISSLNSAPHFLQSSFPPHLPFSSPCFFFFTLHPLSPHTVPKLQTTVI